MTEKMFTIESENASVTATLIDGKITDKKVTFKSVSVDYDDAISFIKAICDIANLKRIKGYVPYWTFSTDDNKLIIRQIKSKKD